MKRKILCLFLILFSALTNAQAFLAEDIKGKTKVITSDNGLYSFEITWLFDETQRSYSALCKFKESSKIFWSKILPVHMIGWSENADKPQGRIYYPAWIDIADNGQVLVMLNRLVEGASKSVSLYDRKGVLITEIYFDKEKFDNREFALAKLKSGIKDFADSYAAPLFVVCGSKCGLVNVKGSGISPDGSYYALAGRDGRGLPLFIYLFDVKAKKLLWHKSYDLYSMPLGSIKISPNNKFILLQALGDEGGDYYLFDIQGNLKWEINIPQYTNEQPIAFINNGVGFKIFDGKEEKYRCFKIEQAGNVSEVQDSNS